MIARLLACVLLAGACAGDGGAPGATPSGGTDGTDGTTAGGEKSGSRRQAAPRGPPAPMRLLPADVQGIARIDVKKLRSSPYAQRLQSWLVSAWTTAGSDATPAEARAWIEDVIARTRFVVVGATEIRGRDTEFVAIARGRYEPEMLVPRAAEHIRGAQMRTRDGRAIVTARGTSATALGKKTWVIASDEELDATLRRASRRSERARSPASSRPLGPIADRVAFGQGAADAVSRITEWTRRRIRGSGLHAALEDVQVAGARVELQQGLRLWAVGETGGRSTARALIDHAKRKRKELSSNAFVRMFGFDAYLRATELELDGTKVVLRMHLNRDQTRQLLSTLDGVGGAASSLELGDDGGSIQFQWGTDG